jgi:hypothetical protein
MKPRNPIARALRSPHLRQRIVASRRRYQRARERVAIRRVAAKIP